MFTIHLELLSKLALLKGAYMHIAGTVLIILSLFLGTEAGPWVFFIGVAMVGFEFGKRFANWDWKKERK